MSAGPLRRATAATGLLAMTPVAVLLVLGALTPEDAALRAFAIVASVLLVGNIARAVLTTALKRVERRDTDRSGAEVDEAADAAAGRVIGG